MDLDLLNAHSRGFAEALLGEFPEWAPYLQPALYDGSEGTLLVEVPAPYPGGTELVIDTENDEVTVSFAGWHEHYGTWAGETGDDGTRAALDAVRNIVEERLLAVMAMDGEQWRASWRVAPGEQVETRHGQQTRARSWRGTYDADLTRE